MNIAKLFNTAILCCAFAFSTYAVNGTDTAMGKTQNGRVMQMSGTVEEYNTTDSMLIVRSAMDTTMMDTVKVTPTTNVTIQGQKKKASNLSSGKDVKVWYRMEGDQKVATRIMETKMKKKGGMKERGGMGKDTMPGGSY